MVTRKYRNSPDLSCYVCGYYAGGKHVAYKIVKGAKYCIAYKLYFGMSMNDEGRQGTLHVIFGNL